VDCRGRIGGGRVTANGRLIARLHARHHLLALAAFGCTTMVCATITMPAGVLTQFLTIVGFILGLLVGSGFRDAESAVTVR